MKSRERVIAALNHEQPDRAPVDLSGHRSSGISAVAYGKLREYLGLAARPIRVYDPVQQLAIVDEDILDIFRVDTIELGRAFALEDEHWVDWRLPDGQACQMPAWAAPQREGQRWVLRSESGQELAEMRPGSLYFSQTYYPWAEGSDLDHLEEALGESMWTGVASPPGPLVAGPGGAERLREGARRLREQTDRAIVGIFGGNLLEMGTFLYRNDQFLMLLAGEPEEAHRFLDLVVERHLWALEAYLGAVGEYIDVIVFGDDLGMQTGPMISPATYREFFKGRHKALWSRAKELADVKVNLHCCGGVRELLGDLIEAGLDAINPVQITCRGMEAAGLKRDFGEALCFWGGGCDTRDVLPNGSPAEVKEHVKRQVGTLGPGGGFVFQQVHNIQANVPPENIVAMYEALAELG